MNTTRWSHCKLSKKKLRQIEDLKKSKGSFKRTSKEARRMKEVRYTSWLGWFSPLPKCQPALWHCCCPCSRPFLRPRWAFLRGLWSQQRNLQDMCKIIRNKRMNRCQCIGVLVFCSYLAHHLYHLYMWSYRLKHSSLCFNSQIPLNGI